MNKKQKVGIGISVLGLALVGASTVSATSNRQSDVSTTPRNFFQHMTSEQRDAIKEDFSGMQAHQEAMQTALENKDFDAWKKSMEEQSANHPQKSSVLDVITKDNFDTFVQMHELMQDGKVDEAKAIATELGLPEFNMKVRGMGMMQGKGDNKEFKAQHEAIQKAFENNDYEAWKTTVEQQAKDHPNSPKQEILNVVTEDNFSKFVEIHQLLKDKKLDEAKVIADELGLPERSMGMHKMMKGKGGFMGKFKDISQDQTQS